MSGENDNLENEESQSGFFVSLDESGVGDGEWRHIEEVHRSNHGMTLVYKAQHYGKLFALKCLKKEYCDDINAIALLEKEFDLGFNLRHKNIALTLDFTHVATLGKCVVMEWIDGETLKDYLQNHELSKNKAKSIALQLCDAVEFLHSHQVIHRDLKPLNVMISAVGEQVKVLDFGLSDSSRFTSFKQPAGTPGYVAPELLSDTSNGDVRSDIYSLGVMLSELHPSLAKVARRCMAASADDRYQRVSQVRKALTDRKGQWWWGVALSLTVIAIVMLLLLPRTSEKKETAVLSPADSVSVYEKSNKDILETNKELVPKTLEEPVHTPINEKIIVADELTDRQSSNIVNQNHINEWELIDRTKSMALKLYAEYKNTIEDKSLSDIEKAKASRQFSLELEMRVHKIIEEAHIEDAEECKRLEARALSAARLAIKKAIEVEN
jgi:serine/threonine protein kinase